MKKQILTMIATLTLSALAYGNSSSFICKSANNSVVVTNNQLVIVTTDSSTKMEELKIYKPSEYSEFNLDDSTLNYSSIENSSPQGSLQFTSISQARKTIHENPGAPCANGTGVGYSDITEAFKATVFINGNKKTIKADLNCIEYSGFHGYCRD